MLQASVHGSKMRFRKLWIRVLAPLLLRVIYPLGNRAAMLSQEEQTHALCEEPCGSRARH